MLFINAGAFLSLIAVFVPAVLGAEPVVPEPDGLYTIANIESGHVIDHYRKHSVFGDPVVTDTASASETQIWKVTYVELGESASYITLSGFGDRTDEVHVGNSKGDGLVTTHEPTVFELKRVPDVTIPAYWLLLGGDPELAITGYERRSQLTLEKLVETHARQIWLFYIPFVPTANATEHSEA